MLVNDLGMLVPLEELVLPVENYPVLTSIESALENTGSDLERFTPTTFIRDMTYRYDKLLLNSMEISLNDYILRLHDKFQFY